MPTKIDPGSDRFRACWLAVEDMRGPGAAGEELKSVNATAREYSLTQQTLDKFIREKKLGIDFADQIAARFETSVDGLVWLFLKGGKGNVLAGNVPGWAKAVDEGREEHPDLPYELAARTSLAAAPRYATKGFAIDLAWLYKRHVQVSSTRPAVRKSGT